MGFKPPVAVKARLVLHISWAAFYSAGQAAWTKISLNL
jgi:hypothetical protein